MIRTGQVVAGASALLALAAPPLLVVSLLGLLLWGLGSARRERECEAQAEELAAALPVDPAPPPPGGDANQQLLRVARDAGLVDDGGG